MKHFILNNYVIIFSSAIFALSPVGYVQLLAASLFIIDLIRGQL